MNSLVRSACRFPASRFFSTSQCRQGVIRDFKKFKELQKQFEVDDGTPVYLKKGASDKFIFGVISVYAFFLSIYSMHFAYTMVFPAKPS